MGRYLSSSLCLSSVNKTLNSYCKIRYTMSLLRRDRHVVKPPPCVNSRAHSQLSRPQASRCARKSIFKSAKCDDVGLPREMRRLPVAHFYSSAHRDAFRAQAAAGTLEEGRRDLCSSSGGGRLGPSFSRLSRHINLYFMRQDSVTRAETGEYLGRAQRRSRSHRAGADQNIPSKKETTQTPQNNDEQESETSAPTRRPSRLQLFPMGSIATAFGQKVSYITKHINSVFYRGSDKAEESASLENVSPTRGRRQRRRKPVNSFIMNPAEEELSQSPRTMETNRLSKSSEEGYFQFARHINRYFGAGDGQGKGGVGVGTNGSYKMSSTSRTRSTKSQLKDESVNEDLFHSSSNLTTFGESHVHISSHINHYFKGRGASEQEQDTESILDPGLNSFTKDVKKVSLVDCFLRPRSAIPDLVGSYFGLGDSSQPTPPAKFVTSPRAALNKKFVLSQSQADEVTVGLLDSLRQAPSTDAVTACVETLNEHIIRHPSCRGIIWQKKATATLLRLQRFYRRNERLQAALRVSLALIGYVEPVKGRGIRVLSIDGGGARGLVPLQVLTLLEEETGKKIHELFDYICGVSTGAILAFMLGLAHFSLEECTDIYRRFGTDVFRQNPVVGTVQMGLSHSYYNTEAWEALLQERLGERVLITTAGDQLNPKVSAVSAVVNWGTTPKAFVFRNYNHTPGSLSRYPGGSGYPMWQAVRASSAAPGYFQEFTVQGDIHQDGGILLNNPCALAIHESHLLWPNEDFQCVLSLGTGRYDPVKRGTATPTSLRAKIDNLICSATDTEGVHILLDDLLAQNVYFRFNPMLSTEVTLDENRPGVIHQLETDTRIYLERNRAKLSQLCLMLGADRSLARMTKDLINERVWEMKQRYM